MWLAIILIVVLSLVIGPVLMMRPSPAQQQKERMRALAYEKGIRFSLKNLPVQATDQISPSPVSVYFFSPSKKNQDSDWFLLRTSYQHEIHFLGCWAWQGDLRATPAEQVVLSHYLPLLPESVRAVSVGSLGICVYWHEKGGEPVLALVVALLEALKNLQLDQQ